MSERTTKAKSKKANGAKPASKAKRATGAKTATQAKPASKTKARKSGMAATRAKPPLKPNKDGVILLSGGNPQIPKGDGDAPVQAYLAAMPGWKRDVGRRLDALIVDAVPHVRKAVKWNSPFYGVEGQGWFVSFHCFNRYIKLTFFAGTSLRPVPPGPSKDKAVRYFDVYEDAPLNEAQLIDWFKQAAALPGWTV